MAMASTISSPLVQALSLRSERNAHPPSCKANGLKSAPTSFTSRRQLLFLLTAAPALTARESASIAEDIPLFGLMKKLKKAEELVREGFEMAEKGIERAEEGIETAERIVEGAVSLEGVAQAGAVGGAELVGVIVATSVVNGILGPEKS